MYADKPWTSQLSWVHTVLAAMPTCPVRWLVSRWHHQKPVWQSPQGSGTDPTLLYAQTASCHLQQAPRITALDTNLITENPNLSAVMLHPQQRFLVMSATGACTGAAHHAIMYHTRFLQPTAANTLTQSAALLR